MNLKGNHTILNNHTNKTEGFPIELIFPTILVLIFCIICICNNINNINKKKQEDKFHPTLALTQKYNPLMSTKEIIINAQNNIKNNIENNHLHCRNDKYYENDLGCYNMV